MRVSGDRVGGLTVTVNGAGLWLDPRGALWWADEGLLVVSDLHLEKGSCLAGRGALIPPYDTRETLGRLAGLMHDYRPAHVISLGDSFHDRTASARLSGEDRDMLAGLVAATDWIWLLGNHDPLPPAKLGGRWVETLRIGPLRFVHEPRADAEAGEIAGHLHPAASIRARGRKVRRRAFATDGSRLVMPAFGAFAGGLCVRDPAIAGLFPAHFLAAMMGNGRLYPVASERLSRDEPVRTGRPLWAKPRRAQPRRNTTEASQPTNQAVITEAKP